MNTVYRPETQNDLIDPEYVDVNERLDDTIKEFESRIERAADYLEIKHKEFINAKFAHECTAIILDSLKSARSNINSPVTAEKVAA